MQFLISVLDTATGTATDAEMAAIRAFNDGLRSSGRWVLACGIESPESASVIDGRGAEPVIAPGLHAAADEYASGFWIVQAGDRDEAVALAAEASRACNRRVELRPLIG